VFKNQIACGKGQDQRPTRAKGHKKIGIGLLQMWKAPAVSVFCEWRPAVWRMDTRAIG
jgi:hypothetical protein